LAIVIQHSPEVDRIILIGVDRTAVEASRMDAVMAGGGHRLLERAGVSVADEQRDGIARTRRRRDR
jgi:hypothetical protein